MDRNEIKLKTFIKTHVPESDRLESELKKSQYLGKRKQKKCFKNKIKKAKFISRREKRSIGLLNLPRNGMKYVDALQLYDLWKEYMNNQLDIDNKVPTILDKNWENISGHIFKLDYHGALLSVVSSKCPSLIGTTGICLIETKNTFKIISKDNTIKTIPKDQCEFLFHLGNVQFRIFGKHICRRPAERSVKNSKNILLSEL